ncbi:MAG: hypothetical protein AB7I19_15745 [Planctomycetota bacterium]
MTTNDLGMRVRVRGDKYLTCGACAHDLFVERSWQLNTGLASFFGFDWANYSATCYVCVECGYVHWFATHVTPRGVNGPIVPFTRRTPPASE